MQRRGTKIQRTILRTQLNDRICLWHPLVIFTPWYECALRLVFNYLRFIQRFTGLSGLNVPNVILGRTMHGPEVLLDTVWRERVKPIEDIHRSHCLSVSLSSPCYLPATMLESTTLMPPVFHSPTDDSPTVTGYQGGTT